MTLTNIQRDAIVSFVDTDKGLHSAELAQAIALQNMVESGITSSFIEKHSGQVKGIYAEHFLDKVEAETFLTSAGDRKSWAKPAKQEYDRINKKVGGRISRMRSKLEELEIAAGAKGQDVLEGAKAKVEKAKASKAGSPKTSAIDLCMKELQACYNRVTKGAHGEACDFTQDQAKEIRAALVRAADVMGKELKEPELSK
jgi:ElaB/YqjD/DUF883 family membrane-anchored ribosome-binding protein